MKRLTQILFFLTILFIGFVACKTNTHIIVDNMGQSKSNEDNADSADSRLRIRIGSKTFTATLLENETASAFKARLPITVAMSDLNGNEKLYNFSGNMPVNSSKPGTIRTGDLMLYGAGTLVLFYKTFSTQYSYTKLGRIDDASGLAAAVGSGNVTVTFEPE